MTEIAVKANAGLKPETTFPDDRAQQRPITATAKLSVSELEVTFENQNTGELTAAVDQVSLDVQAGEFVSIVGLSGCGKSSFLNAVAGLLRPRGGSIQVGGRQVNGPGNDRAVVFQKASLLPWRTVLDNIVYGLELHGVKKDASRKLADKYIDMVHLKGFEHYYPHQLSGGMQQRVNLARALVCEPEVLLLDEPFAALDAITRESMHHELLALWEQTRKTVLMVTHQIDEAVLLSDRIVIFSARPAKIVAEVKITLPRPRTPQLKDNAEFDFLAKKVWGLIHTTTGKKASPEYEI